MIQRIRGTKDILDTQLLTFAIDTLKKVFEQHNYKEIITPILESTDLFKRSLGTETDVVSKEMFLVSSSSQESFKESFCLRPEATASTVRAFIQAGIDTLPWKVYSYGPMFRYERPQKGRYRQFYQFNIECIGDQSLYQDVMLIALLDTVFTNQFKLVNYVLHINFLATLQEREAFKIKLHAFLEQHKEVICKTCLIRKETNILRVLDCKKEECSILYKTAPKLSDCFTQESLQEWQLIQDQLRSLSVNFIVNPYLVRGLDYYNKTVFEFVSSDLGAQSAFCGGGRYESLVSQVGGKKDQPCVGAAVGIDRLLVLLDLVKNELNYIKENQLLVVLPLSDQQTSSALHLAHTLIKQEKTVEIIFNGSIKSMMRKANKMGASYVIIIGEKEQNNGTVILKNMVTGKEQEVKQTEVVQFL